MDSADQFQHFLWKITTVLFVLLHVDQFVLDLETPWSALARIYFGKDFPRRIDRPP